MNVFDKAIELSGLTTQSQGRGSEFAWAYALLAIASQYETAHPTADVLADPFDEVLRRFASVRQTFAGQRLAQIFGDVR